MIVVELTYPGTWLDLPDAKRAFELSCLLTQVEGQVADAALSLGLFSEAPVGGGARMREDWERDAVRRQELIRQVVGSGLEYAALPAPAYAELSARVDLEIERERWAAGTLPRTYETRLAAMHARSFVYALDNIVKTLAVLSKEDGAPGEVATQVDVLLTSFPSLIGVRDTAHHAEDRGRGLDRNKKPLILKPITDQYFNAPQGGVLLLDCLMGNKYVCTTNDGSKGELEVSEASLRIVQGCVQKVLDAFSWKGPRRHVPT